MRFTAHEHAQYARDGFVLREKIFDAAELADLHRTIERVVADIVAHAQRPDAGPTFTFGAGHRLQFSSRTVIQWEWREGSRAVRLMEPFTHLDPAFMALWDDPRFVEPMKDALGVEAVGPFTCKLNLKRPREGSEFPWHQDYPYWYVRTPEHAHEVVTGMLFLDDATVDNGALRVLPGSHLRGPAPRDRHEVTGFLADPLRIDVDREVMIEAAAGSLLIFPALLLHHSTPNTSARQRRAMLLSFQPAGRVRHEELPWHPERVDELP